MSFAQRLNSLAHEQQDALRRQQDQIRHVRNSLSIQEISQLDAIKEEVSSDVTLQCMQDVASLGQYFYTIWEGDIPFLNRMDHDVRTELVSQLRNDINALLGGGFHISYSDSSWEGGSVAGKDCKIIASWFTTA